jgi:biotin transport system substrate-specific component
MSTPITLARESTSSRTLDLGWAVAGSLFIAACAQVSLIFPFTPVPFSLQSQAVLLVAMLLGPRRAFMAVCAYLLEGIAGAPVFALGGFGLASLLGPSGGYLLSYLPASYVVGSLFAANRDCGRLRGLLLFMTGTAIVLACGGLWLSCYIGVANGWLFGVYPFLMGDFLKAVILALALPQVRKAVSWIS